MRWRCLAKKKTSRSVRRAAVETFGKVSTAAAALPPLPFLSVIPFLGRRWNQSTVRACLSARGDALRPVKIETDAGFPLKTSCKTKFQLTQPGIFSSPPEKDLRSYFADEEARATLRDIPPLSALAAVQSELTLYFSSARHVFLPRKLKQ